MSYAHTNSANPGFRFPGLSVILLCEHVNTEAVAYVQKRLEGRGKVAVPSPHTFCESHFCSLSSLKLKAPTLANWGGVILMMPKMPVTNAGRRRETALLWSCSCCHLLPALSITLGPLAPYPLLSPVEILCIKLFS